jgi:hypothetical protein
MKRYDPSYYYYNILDSNEANNYSTIINNKKDTNNINTTNNINMNNNNDNEMNQDEFMFISYVTVTQKSLLQRLANILRDPEILDDDPQVMDAILEWYHPPFYLFLCVLVYTFYPPYLFIYLCACLYILISAFSAGISCLDMRCGMINWI